MVPKDIAKQVADALNGAASAEDTEIVLQSGASIYREFCEKNPISHPAELIHPGLKARRIARYLEHLADVFERGSREKTDEGMRRATIAAMDIQRHVLDQGLPHERLAKVVDTNVRELPHKSDRTIASLVIVAMMHSHPEVGIFLELEKIETAIRLWRTDGRKNRAERRAEASMRGNGTDPRFEALAEVLEGTGAQVAASTIKQAFHGRKLKSRKRRT